MITVGWEKLPKCWSIYGCDPEVRIVEPVPVVLIETLDGWVLLDTGFNKALIEDSALYKRFHSKFHLIEPILPPYETDPLLDILEKLRVDPDDVVKVAISHLHNDHAGGIRHFAQIAPICIQKRELDFGFGDQAKCEGHGLARVDYDDPFITWDVIEGDAAVAHGVDALFTPGHTPGHMSFAVHFDGDDDPGGLIFAFDAGDLEVNFSDELAIGGYIDVNPEFTIEQIRKLKRKSFEYGYPIVPGHDPQVWPTLEEGLVRQVR